MWINISWIHAETSDMRRFSTNYWWSCFIVADCIPKSSKYLLYPCVSSAIHLLLVQLGLLLFKMWWINRLYVSASLVQVGDLVVGVGNPLESVSDLGSSLSGLRQARFSEAGRELLKIAGTGHWVHISRVGLHLIFTHAAVKLGAILARLVPCVHAQMELNLRNGEWSEK
jgi:hypothetical protein